MPRSLHRRRPANGLPGFPDPYFENGDLQLPPVDANVESQGQALLEGRPATEVLMQLSPRELEVLAIVARGRTNREIARTLCISEETVKAHVSSILSKLGLTDRTQAAICGLQQRLVPLDQALDEQ